MKTISLTRGKIAIVDDEDCAYLSSRKWNCSHYGYAVDRDGVKMHRVIMMLSDSSIHVDHINGDTLDNRKTNLRLCKAFQNIANSKIGKANKSGFKGVYWDASRNKWASQIKFHRKSVYLGRFDDKKEAALAYNQKAIELFGEFARLNVIEGV